MARAKSTNGKFDFADWQDDLCATHPEDLLCGLFHSDGCRITSKIRHGEKIHGYPRYHFANESTDIIEVCRRSLDRLEIGWRRCRPNLLSVARRADVTRLNKFIGPKW